MDKNLKSILQDAMEQEIPSSQIDLWSGVKARLVTGRKSSFEQGAKMNSIQSRRRQRLAFAILIIAALVAVALITPRGRAFAQNILQFFIRSESDAIPVPTSEPVTWIDVTPGIPSATRTPLPPVAIFANECGDYAEPVCTVEQIREKVDFVIKEPGKLPNGLYFVGATGGPDNVFLAYYYVERTGSLMVTVERWAGVPSPEEDLIGASATVEEVQIGNRTGEYFQGVFVSESDGSVAHWDPNFGLETLRWVEDGISYTMQYSHPPASLGKEGMVALAESMTTQPVSKLPMPASTPIDDWDPGDRYNLSISEAEQQAGFKLQLPATLPEIFSLSGATFDTVHEIAETFFGLDQSVYGPTTEGITLRQQAAPDSRNCRLCGISIGDYNKVEGDPQYLRMVPSDSDIEIVEIGAGTGEYIQGVWSGTDCCGWVWDSTPPMKTLRWWANGMAFEMVYFGENLEKADMVRIAESLK